MTEPLFITYLGENRIWAGWSVPFGGSVALNVFDTTNGTVSFTLPAGNEIFNVNEIQQYNFLDYTVKPIGQISTSYVDAGNIPIACPAEFKNIFSATASFIFGPYSIQGVSIMPIIPLYGSGVFNKFQIPSIVNYSLNIYQPPYFPAAFVPVTVRFSGYFQFQFLGKFKT